MRGERLEESEIMFGEVPTGIILLFFFLLLFEFWGFCLFQAVKPQENK